MNKFENEKCNCLYPIRDKNYSICMKCSKQLGVIHQCMNCKNNSFMILGILRCKFDGYHRISTLKKEEHCAAQDMRYHE